MRTIETKHGQYEVEFFHLRLVLSKKPLRDIAREGEANWEPVTSIPHKTGGSTTCHVIFTPRAKWRKKLRENRKTSVLATANCSILDDFSESRGESLSLARAIRKIHGEDRDARLTFWTAWEGAE